MEPIIVTEHGLDGSAIKIGKWKLVLQDDLRLARNLNREEWLVTNKDGTAVYLLLHTSEKDELQILSRWQVQFILKGRDLFICKDEKAPATPFEDDSPLDNSKRNLLYRLGEWNDRKTI